MKKTGIFSILLISLALLGCTNSSVPTGSDSITPSQNKLSKGPAQEFSVNAKEGGSVSLKLSDSDSLKIIFPQETLAQDSNLEISPITQSEEKWSVPGFGLVEKGSSVGPKMNFPALLIFQTTKTLSDDAAIFERAENGDKVLPTNIERQKGKTILTAQVEHFSDYGIRDMEGDEKSQQQQNKKEAEKYNWVIYVNDSSDTNIGPLKATITLNFKAINTSGDILGTYQGTASASTVSSGNVSRGYMDSNAALHADPFSFSVTGYIDEDDQLAPLTENDDDKLAPLVPDEEDDGKLAPLTPPSDDEKLAPLKPEQTPDFMATGNIHMAGGGTATGTIGAYSGSGPVKSDSTDQFTIMVTGPLVRLSVNIAGHMMYFDGYIRGEGK